MTRLIMCGVAAAKVSRIGHRLAMTTQPRHKHNALVMSTAGPTPHQALNGKGVRCRCRARLDGPAASLKLIGTTVMLPLLAMLATWLIRGGHS